MATDIGTIQEVIETGKERYFTNGKFHFKEFIDYIGQDTRIVFNYDSLFRKYRYMLEPYIVTVELSDKQMLNYQYQPRKFCSDFLGNMELWSFLLLINGMITTVEFNRKRIKSFTQGITDVLSDIMTIEIDRLEENYIEILRN